MRRNPHLQAARGNLINAYAAEKEAKISVRREKRRSSKSDVR